MRHLAVSLVTAGLLSVSCVRPPIAYQDGLPAATPPPGSVAARFMYNRSYWRHGNTDKYLGPCFGGGVRFGQDWRALCFEEGLTVLYPNVLLPCLQAGIGLRRPAVTLRCLWTPVAVGGGVRFDPMLWWQVSGLVGSPRTSKGLGVSYGARTSRIGIGPVAVLDYTHSGISLRLESSVIFPPPWASQMIRGKVPMLGLSAEPIKGVRHK